MQQEADQATHDPDTEQLLQVWEKVLLTVGTSVPKQAERIEETAPAVFDCRPVFKPFDQYPMARP